ncbi:Uncharacterised protein r2_g766 [Pycnogonum litorale]
MNWIDVRNRDESGGVALGDCRVSRLLFVVDMVLLSSSEKGLQHARDRFDAECSDARMKISVAKTETLLLSRRPGQCILHVDGVPRKRVEKFEYLGVVFTSDSRQDIELDTIIAAAEALMRQLQRSLLLRLIIISFIIFY